MIAQTKVSKKNNHTPRKCIPNGAAPVLAIVSPCYNEELIVASSVQILLDKLKLLQGKEYISKDSYLCLVDDGSQDDSWSTIADLAQQNDHIRAIRLAANTGHQNALAAGLKHVRENCDCCITIDIDLQDDLGAFDTMLENYKSGCEVVFGVKKTRESDGWLKKFFARGFYRLLSAIGIKTIPNHADFRLLGSKALAAFNAMPETNLYLRGIFTNMGFRSTTVHYHLSPRGQGNSKYSPPKMLSLAWNGISGFSVVPLRLVSVAGLLTFMFSGILAIDTLWTVLFTEEAVPGWASTVLPIYFLGGIQLLALGIIGEYVGKIFIEAKRRPRYFIEETIGDDKG